MRITIVPLQIVEDIAEVREYGIKKYGSSDSWKRVGLERYIDATFRHLMAFINDHESIDQESGIKHYKHICCNMAFISHLMNRRCEHDTKRT